MPWLGEPLSAITHLAGAVFFLSISKRLIRRGRGNRGRVVSLSIFAFACVFQLVMSGFSHQLVPGSAAARVLLRLDHAAIFFLIAATFTPMHVILFRGVQRWAPLAFVWVAAVFGIVLKSVFFAHVPMWLGVTLYLSLGWFGLVTGIMICRRYHFRFMSPLLYGGLSYSLGVVLEVVSAGKGIQLIPGVFGGHEVFHLAVLIGMGLHWRFISGFADGKVILSDTDHL